MPDNIIQVADVFKPLFEDNYLNFILEAGRDSGKTKTADILVGITTAIKPNEDIVICRASYGSIADSIYNEVCEVFESIDCFADQFVYRKSPLRIIRRNTNSTIYFMGVGGSTDRTKGFKPKNKVSLLILEETQELKSREHLDQTLASLRRRFGKDCKVVIIFNPPSQELSWINLWAKECENDKDYCVIKSTWLDVAQFLNDRDITDILKLKYENEDYYNWLYLGMPTGKLGLIYPMFRKELHMIQYESRSTSKCLQDFRIVGCIIGCDGAVTHDCTALVPLLIMSNGQCAIGKIFYHNPIENGVKGSFPLVENEITRWFKELRQDNNLDNAYDYMASVPIAFICDSAATDLIQALHYYFSNRALVYPIKKGTIPQMVGTVQNAIGKNIITVYDYGGYQNYTLNKWVKSDNVLSYQIQMMKWNEKQNGYDPIVPNDVCDAFTYAVYYYYKNTENLIWLDAINRIRQDYYRIKDK